MSDCNSYGIMSGCDTNCPVLWEGRCEIIKDVLENLDLSNDEEDELIEIYGL